MCTDSLAKYYKKKQRKTERLQKKVLKGIKIFLKKKETKSNKMIMNDVKIFLSMKSIG